MIEILCVAEAHAEAKLVGIRNPPHAFDIERRTEDQVGKAIPVSEIDVVVELNADPGRHDEVHIAQPEVVVLLLGCGRHRIDRIDRREAIRVIAFENLCTRRKASNSA